MNQTPDSEMPDPSTPPPIELPSAIRGEYRKRSYRDPWEDESGDEDERRSRLEPEELDAEEAEPLMSPPQPDWEAAEEAAEPSVGLDHDYVPPVTVREWERQLREVPQVDRAAAPSNVRQADYPQPSEGAVKIGLWGSPQSGKTTYLAALRHATGAGDTGCGSWNIYPRNDASRDLLVRFTHTLVHERRFPEATSLGVTVPLEWLFVGDIARSKFDRRRLLRRGRLESRFVLDLIDVTGGAFAHDPDKAGVAPHVATAALDHLTDARGLIYLFDPIGEKENRDSFTYMNRTIAELLQRSAASTRAGLHLPHYVSVCVSKFDHPEIFQQARRLGLVNYGHDGMPRVRDEHAEQFFDALCEGDFWHEHDEQGQASAQFVRDQLKTVFDPSRIRYFVTSSIGFWRPPGWDPSASRFNPDDFANYLIKDGQPSIKGAINPINVLEPLINLQQWVPGQV
jgi:hypothetical protein